MNTLFCIGKNYSFKPLQKYSICYAQSLFGEIQCTWFLDSLNDTNCLKNLNYAIESSQNLLILAKDSVLNEILEYFKKYSFSTPIFKKTHHTLAFKNCNIILQESPKITQFRDADNTFLYLLELDCQSALTLLNPLAKAYQIQLQILQETCGIEILHAKALSHKSLDNFLQEMQQTFQNKIFASSNLAQSIIQLLANSKQKITTAESCTGGFCSIVIGICIKISTEGCKAGIIHSRTGGCGTFIIQSHDYKTRDYEHHTDDHSYGRKYLFAHSVAFFL